MAATSTIGKIYEDLVGLASEAIETKYIFPGERPNTSKEGTPLTSFLVVNLPTPLENLMVGYKKKVLYTDGIIHVFVKGKSNNTLNVNATGNLVDKVLDAFPYVGKCCSCIRPVVRMRGADEYGYHYATISFDIETKVNAFS